MASLMNGLSAMGAGIATFAGQAGLEQQKSDLANQTTRLADQLATTRETTLQQSAGQIAATAAEKQQEFQAGQTAITEAGANTRNAATVQASRDVANIGANAPPDAVKLLRVLGALPPDSGAAPAPAAATPAPLAGPRAAPMAATSPATGPNADVANTLIAKTLGLGLPGSEQAIRASMAKDVAGDPDFKYKTAGQQGAEVATRYAVATGTMVAPATRDQVAGEIANYKQGPLVGNALRTPAGIDVMAAVTKLNPDYNAMFYGIQNKTREDLATGPLGAGLTAANTALAHASEFAANADALNNGRIPAFNWIDNKVLDATGSPRPLSMQETISALAAEARKVYAGASGGTQADLDAWEKNFPLNGSPAQQNAAMGEFAKLLNGRVTAVVGQVNRGMQGSGTKFTTSDVLTPEAQASYQKMLDAVPKSGAAATPAVTATPAAPTADSWFTKSPKVNPPADPSARVVGQSYPLPNGKTGVWQGTGWAVSP